MFDAQDEVGSGSYQEIAPLLNQFAIKTWYANRLDLLFLNVLSIAAHMLGLGIATGSFLNFRVVTVCCFHIDNTPCFAFKHLESLFCRPPTMAQPSAHAYTRIPFQKYRLQDVLTRCPYARVFTVGPCSLGSC